MTESERHWLAGFLEGEGCFRLDKRNYPTIDAASTDYDVLCRVSVLIDAQPPRLHREPEPGHKQAWRVQLGGQRALEVMEAIQPLMGDRRRARIADVLANVAPRPMRTRRKNPGMAALAFSD